jgi:uncharacterized membrane protein YraQ (UPF0718 family)
MPGESVMQRLEEIVINSLIDIKGIVPIFFVAVLVSTLLELYLPSEIVFALLGRNLLIAIPLATVIGIVLPIPRYATYPLAYALLAKGAGLAVIFCLISGEVILGSLERDVMEFRYFGWRSYLLRLSLCSLFVIMFGFLLEVLL